jgi:hypothetical protein
MRLPLWWRRLASRFAPPRRLRIVEGDSLPKRLPWRDVVLARDQDEDWCVGMRCPCGCGQTLELLIIREAAPRWDLIINAGGLPSLKPSVWRRTGCRSHFWLRDGRVDWCE